MKIDGIKCSVGLLLNHAKNRGVSFLTDLLGQSRPEATCPSITSLPGRLSRKLRHAITSMPASFSCPRDHAGRS